MPRKLIKESGPGKVLLEWWQGLEDDRACRARLRRAATVTAVVMTPDFQRLLRHLEQSGWQASWPEQKDRLAAVVGLLAHVKEDSDLKPAKEMSRFPDGGDRPKVSELRFLRVLESPDLETRFIALRRVLPLVKDKLNVLELANDLLYWGDDVKKQWAYSYDWPDKSGH